MNGPNVNWKTVEIIQEYGEHDDAALCEKLPDTEFFLVRIFPHSDRIRRDTKYLSVFSPNAGKYGPEKTSYLDTFHAVLMVMN